MQDRDLLLTSAEVAVTFAGFASLVTVFGSRSSRDGAQIDANRLRTMLVGRDREDPEGLPSEMLLVLFPGMRGEIRSHFALEARLQEIGAGDGHRAAVDLDREVAA